MIDTNRAISALLAYGKKQGLFEEEDTVYVANRVMAKLGIAEFTPVLVETVPESPAAILDELLDWAAENGKLENNSVVYRDILDTEIMDCLMMRPSEVIRRFNGLYAEDKKAATDFYYHLSCASNYIRTDRVAKDMKWEVPTEQYGDLVMTINLSKPEKDPKAIAAAKNMKQTGYPKCALCKENEGFAGSVSQAARANHRVIPLTLGNEPWFFQYSPYVYYNEHCIIFNGEHTPMKISRRSFERLLEFVGKFPHYFLGSNADLPIVGGSILTHDHFQGGNFEFPMAKAPVRRPVKFAGFEDVEAGIVQWPMSVLRLRSNDAERLCELADKILNVWRGYSDEAADIRSETEGTPHNTVTPIARTRDGLLELDLVLRNNRTTEEHPLGIFHPHAQWHHIKKENIGLIEVMGLAVLPARLKTELALVEEALRCPEKEAELMAQPGMDAHAPWLEELKAANIPAEEIAATVQRQVGEIFLHVLEDAGVYKNDIPGRVAFLRFVDAVNNA
ncbi:MAG: UDP-glucose--hexose-1-phosphate uridylyltransferase [Clostridia bacterium]|nr:UDP-glucose--hexose-1-phosphate uridylyltransferase [Clostridia bacterium]